MRHPHRWLRYQRWLELHGELFPPTLERLVRVAAFRRWRPVAARDRRVRVTLDEAILPMRSLRQLRRWQVERATVRQLALLHHLALTICIVLRDTENEDLYALWSRSIEERGGLGLARAALILLEE